MDLIQQRIEERTEAYKHSKQMIKQCEAFQQQIKVKYKDSTNPYELEMKLRLCDFLATDQSVWAKIRDKEANKIRKLQKAYSKNNH